jgi:hypothetical protein
MTKNRNIGYCAVCDKEYSNIYQHNRTQRHKRLSEREQKKEEMNINVIEDNPSITTSNNSGVGSMDEAKVLNEHSIKIIDGTVKESKSAIKEIVEIATSEQFMPITMALLQGLANLANGHLNKQESAGMIKTQGGLEREDF